MNWQNSVKYVKLKKLKNVNVQEGRAQGEAVPFPGGGGVTWINFC